MHGAGAWCGSNEVVAVQTALVKYRVAPLAQVGAQSDVRHLQAITERAKVLRQFEVIRPGREQPSGSVTLMWSWLRPEAERRYMEGGLAGLLVTDLGGEGSLWLLAVASSATVGDLKLALIWAGKRLPRDSEAERFRWLGVSRHDESLRPFRCVNEGGYLQCLPL